MGSNKLQGAQGIADPKRSVGGVRTSGSVSSSHLLSSMKSEGSLADLAAVIRSSPVAQRYVAVVPASFEASAAPASSERNVFLSAKRNVSSPAILQRQPFTNEEVRSAITGYSKHLASFSHQILIPWDHDWHIDKANCHGFTVTGKACFIDGSRLLTELGEDGREIAVFVKNGDIAHSGIINGSKLRHLLKGIGAIESDVGADLMGYDQRFTLPSERHELDTYLAPTLMRQEIFEIDDLFISYLDTFEHGGQHVEFLTRLREGHERFNDYNLEAQEAWDPVTLLNLMRTLLDEAKRTLPNAASNDEAKSQDEQINPDQ